MMVFDALSCSVGLIPDQPCCVCNEEKAARDECMLFAKSDNPIDECESMVAKYKTCMAGFGFEIP
jgi:cytochrome c oxidase assembly protein subunit 17